MEEPLRYLKNGPQTTMTDYDISVVRSFINKNERLLSAIKEVINWKSKYFTNDPAGGKYIGTRNIGDILRDRTLTGCHDHGIVVASVLRQIFNYPVIMLETVNIQWAKSYMEKTAKGFHGHVLLEIYHKNRWILLDSTSGYLELNYNPESPVIDAFNSAYYTILKGLDPLDYGVTSIEHLEAFMIEFARANNLKELQYNSYKPRHINELI